MRNLLFILASVAFAQTQSDYVTRVRNKPAVDAREYGVKADGCVTDNTTALQAALNASIGGSLVLPAGCLKITSALTLNTAVAGETRSWNIQGQGFHSWKQTQGTIIRNDSVTGGNTLEINNNLTEAGDKNQDNRITIEGIHFFGNQYSGSHLVMTNATGVKVRNNYFHNAGVNHVILNDSWSNDFYDNIMLGSGGSAVEFTGTNNAITFFNNRIYSTGLKGSTVGVIAAYHLSGTAALQINIIGGDITGVCSSIEWGTAPATFCPGILATNVKALNVNGVYSEGVKGSFAYLSTGTRSFNIVGNYIQDAVVETDGANGGTISGNHFYAVGTGKTITGIANNGSSLCRVTSTAHGFLTGQYVKVSGVTGTTEANISSLVTRVSADAFDMAGCTFANAWISGGSAVAGAGIVVGYDSGTQPDVAIQGNTVNGDDWTAAGYIAPLAGSITANITQNYSTTSPTFGTWRVGSIVWNSVPSPSACAFWVCTTAGSPGTWKCGATVEP